MLEMASTGRPTVSAVRDYFEYSEIEEKSVCKVLVKIQGEDAQEEECRACIAGKYPTNLRAHLKSAYSAVLKEVERQ